MDSAAAVLSPLLLWIGALIVALVIATVVILLIRRSLLGDEDDERSSGLMLTDLRSLRDRGEITQGEYEAARQAVIRRVRAGLGRDENTPD